MTDPNLSYVVSIVDRSGSMALIKEDTDGGFNAFIDEQKKVEGKCLVTLAQFDDKYELVYENVDVSDVPKLDLKPRGYTALHDAIGKTIVTVGEKLAKLKEDKRPSSITVVIVTDGGENDSKDWSGEQVKDLITQQQDKYQWRFLFMGANQDAVTVGSNLGIGVANSLTYTGKNVKSAFASAATNTATYRAARSSGVDYSLAVAGSAFTPSQREDATTGN